MNEQNTPRPVLTRSEPSNYGTCPKCESLVHKCDGCFCRFCGQALNWEDNAARCFRLTDRERDVIINALVQRKVNIAEANRSRRLISKSAENTDWLESAIIKSEKETAEIDEIIRKIKEDKC